MDIKFILAFLKDLEKNNKREWFNNNKERYLEAKKQFEVFVASLIPEMAKFDREIKNIEAKTCIFRIYNDARFHNKPPYKTNMGAHLTKGGKNAGNAGYYLHIEPGGCFLGGGIYMPQPDKLKLIRQEIYYNIDKFLFIVENRDFKKYFRAVEGEKISRVPKDFPPDAKGGEFLKFKYYTVIHSFKPDLFLKQDAKKYILSVFTHMTPLNHFLNTAITT